MARPRTSSRRPSEPSDEPELLVPRAEFEEALADRLARGEELRDREIRSEPELEAARQAKYSWHEFNATLLRRSFSTSKVAETYSYIGPMVYAGPYPFPQEVADFRKDVSSKLRRLTSLKEQLPLYGDGPSSPASLPTETTQLLGTGVFIVHGHHEALKSSKWRAPSRG